MSLKILIFYFFSSIFFLTNNLYASHVTVVDGDTIKLGDVKIRFSGIDAPEIIRHVLQVREKWHVERYQEIF